MACLVSSILSFLSFLRKMNQLDVAALDKVVAYSSCWQGVILCPNEDGCGEYNLLCQKALQFRKTKCAGKEGGLSVGKLGGSIGKTGEK